MKEDIRTLFSEKLIGDETIIDHHELYDHLDWDGSIHEIIDGNIEIYNYPLRQWAVDNWEYVEDAISEGLTEGVTDYHKLIQWGQYVKLSEEARIIVEELYSELDGLAFNNQLAMVEK